MPPTLTANSNTAAALTPKRLFTALGACLFAVFLVLIFGEGRPGEPLPQLAGAVGAMLLLVPAVFSWHKRIGGAQRPRAWFVAHVLASLFAVVCVVLHLRAGSLWSPPGVMAFALVFLVLQGVFARATLGRRYAQLFARSPAAFSPVVLDRQRLATVIERKVELLGALDASADEALFSLQGRHWCRSPKMSWQYASLVQQERALVGANKGVSLLLLYWRRLHLLAAALFVFALLAHVLVVLFFAGYAASGEVPYWWHLFAWGADWGADWGSAEGAGQ